MNHENIQKLNHRLVGIINSLETAYSEANDMNDTNQFTTVNLFSHMIKINISALEAIWNELNNVTENETICDFDLALLDDDLLLIDTWKLIAGNRGIRLFATTSVNDLVNANLNKNCPIYIDKHFGESNHGIKIANEFHKLGYRNIFLTTGDRCNFEDVLNNNLFLKGVINKQFPKTQNLEVRHG